MSPEQPHSVLSRFSRRAGVLLASACLLLLALGVLAQSDGDNAEEDLGVFIEPINVDIVNVDVYVTDKKGNPVRGLKASDFELFEDGRPMRIENFYAVEEGAARLPEGQKEEKPETNEVPELPRRGLDLPKVEVPEDQRLRLIVFIDNLFIEPFSRNRVMQQLRRFLRTGLGPDDQVMLVTFERSTNIRHPFTSNRQAVIDELLNLEKLSGFAVQGNSERRDIIRRIEMAEDALEAEGHVVYYAQSRYNDITMSIRAMKDLVGSLAGLEGRKAFLHVSDGMPMMAGADLFQYLEDNFRDGVNGRLLAGRYSARRQFRELTATANANRVTFYTLEAKGLRAHESISAANGGRNGGRLSGGSFIDIDYARVINNTEPLDMMAEDTGGRSVYGTNNLAGALANMAQDFRFYYSLGYAPPAGADGRYHKIEVKPKNRSYKVRHRTGYRSRSIEAQVNDFTVATLLYGVEANPLSVDLRMGRALQQDNGNSLVTLEVRVPIGSLTLVPREGQHQGRLRVSVAVIDEEGNLSPVEQKPVPVLVAEGDVETAVAHQHYVYEVQLLMRAGDQRVAVGVRDDFSGQVSYVRKPVRI